MPATPEVGNVLGGVRAIEVGRERDAEQQGGAQRDVGVAGEIVVKLERIAVGARQHFGARVEFGQIEDAIHQAFGQEVGDQELLDQAQANEKERLASVLRAEHFALGPLRPKCGEARDGSRDGGWEEARRREVSEIAPGRCCVAAVDVDGVGERLETVEGKRQWQHPGQHRQVFYRGDEPDIEGDAERYEQSPQAGARGAMERAANEKIARGCHRNDGEVSKIPACIEEIIREEDDGERAQPVTRGQPIGEEDGGEEGEISRGGQQHFGMHPSIAEAGIRG